MNGTPNLRRGFFIGARAALKADALVAAEIATSEEERGDASSEESLSLNRVSPNPIVLAQDDPTLGADLIAGLHASARRAEDTQWAEIVRLYDLHLTLRSSPVVALNRAIAVAELEGPARGLAAIAAIAGAERLRDYTFYPAALGELDLRRGHFEVARGHCQAALALARSADRAGIFGAADLGVYRLKRIRRELRRPGGGRSSRRLGFEADVAGPVHPHLRGDDVISAQN